MSDLTSVIAVITGAINSLITVFNISLGCSVCCGKFIVQFILKCSTEIFTLACSVTNGLTIMYEDFSHFLYDLQNILFFFDWLFNATCEFVFSLILGINDVLYNCIHLFTYTLVCIKDNTLGMFKNAVKGLYDCIVTVKGSLILIGNMIWMSLTFIPGVLVYLFSLFAFFINRCTDEIISIIKTTAYAIILICTEIFNFTTDMPLESTCGLIIGCCVMYMSYKYKYIIVIFASQQSCKITGYIKNTSLELLIFISQVLHLSLLALNNGFHKVKQTLIDSYFKINQKKILEVATNGNERLCVICQDSETNIVIIPCKHMCLCENCSYNPMFRSRSRRKTSCPVCRGTIEEILKVYL